MQKTNKQEGKIVKIPTIVTVKDFSDILGLSVSDVITELLKNKIIASINEEIDFETASIIAEDMGFKAEENLEIEKGHVISLEELLNICKKEKESSKKLDSRAPIVTILGHVDHGKTTLLDAIRKTNVVEGEKGGITQHIRAYQTKKKGKTITFVDTPGHEAFSAMRERGVSIADIVVLVVAADDGVRPQTKEVIDYLKGKKIPTIIAINKIDKPAANLQKVKQELSDNEIMIEEWGGDIMSAELSAKSGKGIDDLLDKILLLAEVEDFKADSKRDGLAIILESHLDHQKGPIATALVKTGTLKVGQEIIAGSSRGKIKKIEDFSGKNIESAGPSMPINIMGLDKVANVNDIVQVVDRDSLTYAGIKKLKEIRINNSDSAKKRIQKAMAEKGLKKFNIIIKADVQGSLEAIEQILSTIKSKEISIEYVGTGIGNITESDVKIAESSGAAIFGFNVVATAVANRLTEESGVEIKTFNIIYELVSEVKQKMAEMLPPEIIRTDIGRINVLAVFKTGKRDMIIGGRVTEGKVIKGALAEVKREKEIIGKGVISNLQQNKENTEEVGKGNECGVTFEGAVKIEEGDKLNIYKEEEKLRSID